jgi:transposase
MSCTSRTRCAPRRSPPRVRTDAVDVRTLAHLLRADLLPEAYIAPRELRDLRDLLRHGVALTRMRTSLKNRVSAILAKNGIQRPFSDLFGAGGTRFLAARAAREPAPALGQPSRVDHRLHPRDRRHREIDARAKDDPPS